MEYSTDKIDLIYEAISDAINERHNVAIGQRYYDILVATLKQLNAENPNRDMTSSVIKIIVEKINNDLSNRQVVQIDNDNLAPRPEFTKNGQPQGSNGVKFFDNNADLMRPKLQEGNSEQTVSSFDQLMQQRNNEQLSKNTTERIDFTDLKSSSVGDFSISKDTRTDVNTLMDRQIAERNGSIQESDSSSAQTNMFLLNNDDNKVPSSEPKREISMQNEYMEFQIKKNEELKLKEDQLNHLIDKNKRQSAEIEQKEKQLKLEIETAKRDIKERISEIKMKTIENQIRTKELNDKDEMLLQVQEDLENRETQWMQMIMTNKSSTNGSNSTSSLFTIDSRIGNQIELNRVMNVKQIELLSAQLVSTFNITKNNSCNFMEDSKELNCKIVKGMYNATSLAFAIQTSMNSVSACRYRVSYANNQFNIRQTSGDLEWTLVDKGLWKMFGMLKNADFSYESAIKESVCASDYTRMAISFEDDNISQTIGTFYFDSNIHYLNHTFEKPIRVEKFELHLTDWDNKPIALDNVSYIISVRVSGNNVKQKVTKKPKSESESSNEEEISNEKLNVSVDLDEISAVIEQKASELKAI